VSDIRDIVLGLYELAFKVLKTGGKLVFLYPVLTKDYDGSPSSVQLDPRFELLELSQNFMT